MSKSAIFFITFFITLVSQWLLAAGGRIAGIVTDATTNNPLPGANIFLEGTGIGTTTDSEGGYMLTNVPAGSYQMSVVYIGYEWVILTIEVQDDQQIIHNIAMNAVALEGEEIVVTAQAEGQNAAINKQLASESIVNVVSSARIQELPDANAAESIGRLPGVSLVRSGGQATQVVIRGLQPKYNSITIDGVSIPSNDAGSISTSGDYAQPTIDPGGRAVELSMISSNSLAGIQIFKTVTPDMDAAVLGGTVNFDIREAKGEPLGKPLYSFTAQGSYNNLVSKYNDYKFVASAEKRFFNDRFGVFVQGIAQQQNLTSNKLGAGYRQPAKVEAPDSIVLGSMGLSFIPSEQKRFDCILTLDYRLPDGKLSLLNLLSHGKTTKETHSELYAVYGNSIQFDTELSSNELNVVTNILKYEQNIGSFKTDVKLSNSYSDNRTPRAWKLTFFQPSPGTNNISDKLSPVKIAEQAKDLINLDEMYWRGNAIWSSFNKQNETQASVDETGTFNLSQMISLTLKVGAQYKYTTRDYNFDTGYGSLSGGAAEGFRYDLVHALPWLTQSPYNFDEDGTQNFKINGFYDPDMDFGKFLEGDYAIHSAVKADVIDEIMNTIEVLGNNITVPQNVPSFAPNSYGSIASDYNGHEIRSAEYLMGTFNIGSQVNIITGIRYQGLKTSYSAPQFFGNADMTNPYPNPIDHTWVTHDEFHGYWLPDVILKYSPFSWLGLRGAYTTTLAYPDFNQAVPRIDVAGNSGRWAVWNNVALKPAYSQNYDFQLAVYSNDVGLLAVSPFLKRIDDMIFSQESYITDPSKYPGLPDNTMAYRINTFINNPHRVDIWGIESEWQTHFWYLPGILSGFVLNVNYTHLFSEAVYPYTITGNTGFPLYQPIHNDTTYTDRLFQQPEDIVNLSIGFDYKDFSILASMIYQSQVFEKTDFYNALRTDKIRYLRWDLSMKQKLPWTGLELYLNLNNLNSEEDTYAVRGSGFPSSIYNYGLTADFGIRFKL